MTSNFEVVIKTQNRSRFYRIAYGLSMACFIMVFGVTLFSDARQPLIPLFLSGWLLVFSVLSYRQWRKAFIKDTLIIGDNTMSLMGGRWAISLSGCTRIYINQLFIVKVLTHSGELKTWVIPIDASRNTSLRESLLSDLQERGYPVDSALEFR